MTAPARPSTHPPHQLRRGAATLGAPLAWLTQLSVVYALVPTACTSWVGDLATAATTVVAAAAAVGCGLLARGLLARAPAATSARETQLDTLLGASGLMLSALFLVVIVGVGLGAAMVDPCGS